MRRTARIGVLTILFVILAGSSLVAAAPASYVVKSGDCLWNIASANGLTVDQIKQLNGLGSDSLQIGQVLKLTSSNTPAGITSTKVSASVTTPAPAPVPAPAGTALYVVQPGDNLWNIAQRHNTTVDKLRALNGLSSDVLFAGKTLKIAAGAATVSIPVPVPGPAPAPAAVAAAAPAGVSLYVIQPGDNLWSIA
ncbi:MAG: LysM peptidoglycan-binding domain-containing protein, partial [Syntrophomonas sp.]|nr:LysM peptidoglycan-binding domain-containing protein [Syntrophomonas sp.]